MCIRDRLQSVVLAPAGAGLKPRAPPKQVPSPKVNFEPLRPQPRLIETQTHPPSIWEWTRVDAAFRARCVMSVESRHWLDYDPVALLILVVGIGAVALLALSI